MNGLFGSVGGLSTEWLLSLMPTRDAREGLRRNSLRWLSCRQHTARSHRPSPNRLLGLKLKRILNNFGDLLGEIVGSAQVFSKEAHLALDITIHEHLSRMIRDLDLQGD